MLKTTDLGAKNGMRNRQINNVDPHSAKWEKNCIKGHEWNQVPLLAQN